QSRRGHPESAEQIMGLEHAGPDRVAIAGADVVDGGIGEFGQPVDGPADEHRIGVAAGPHPSDRLGGGDVVAGVGEDKDEAPRPAAVWAAPRVWYRGGAGVATGRASLPLGRPWATVSACWATSWRVASSKTVALRPAAARATEVATAAL